MPSRIAIPSATTGSRSPRRNSRRFAPRPASLTSRRSRFATSLRGGSSNRSPSFRNHGDFHEDVVNVIYDDLERLLKPRYLEVYGKFAARGGITIDPFVNGGTGAKYRALAARRFADWKGVRD